MGTENHSKPALATFRAEHLPGRGYYVADPDGRRVSGVYTTRERAEGEAETKQAQADAAKKRRNRPCMCCGQAFASAGIHNRMCNPCRHRASNDEATPFNFGTIHGRKRA